MDTVVMGFVTFLLVYWLPFLVALRRKHHSPGMIFVVNLFLGWTVIFWIMALAAAFDNRKPL